MRNRRGLTLVELVVALVVAGIAMGAGYSGLAVMVDRRASARDASDRVSSAASVRATLERWLSGAELTVEEDAVVFRGLDGIRDGKADDELTFRTSSRTASARPGTTIRLHVDRVDSTRERGLVAELSDERGEHERVIELDPTVDGLDLRYLSALQSKREWSDSWVSTSLLPLAVELRLTSSRTDSPRDILAFPLVVPLGSAR
jgi:prepilin-type N-terminal cleavage/methylation domain-containing protein